jgi:glucose-1-phosphate cytidylyltransferase
MKVVILAGGFGTRISEESDIKPKPMVEIGGKPILWHIMKIYSSYGFNEFVILLGYKSYVIKEYFANYFLHQCDVAIDLQNNDMQILNNKTEPWKVTLLDTGLHTMTGGRILRAKEHLKDAPFLLTYGDGVSNIRIDKLVDFHKSHGKAITMSTVQPEGRFGAVQYAEQDRIQSFLEKPVGDGNWINGGFFVCEPKVLNYIKDDTTVFEQYPLSQLASDGELFAYKHDGFWSCMDTLRDKTKLNELWDKEKAVWKVW